MQHARCGNGYAQGVVHKRPAKVLVHDPHGPFRNVEHLGQLFKIARRQQDARRFDGDVRAAAHGDRAVGACERGCVVHTVADHADGAPLRLEASDHIRLFRRQDIGLDIFYPRLRGDIPRRLLVIAGDEPHLSAACLEFFDDLPRLGLYDIGDADKPHERTVAGCADLGTRAVGQSLRVNAVLFEKPPAAADERFAVYRAFNALTCDRFKVRRRVWHKVDECIFCAGDHRLGDRVVGHGLG